jgi:hypothetical protein
MNLLYKPDWEQTKKNYELWWAHEYFGRCAISVTAPKAAKDSKEPPSLPPKPEDRWTDFDYLIKINEYRMSNTFYGEEAFPAWTAGHPGADSHASYLGAPVTLTKETGWKDPIIEDGELTDYDYNKLVINKDGFWWKFGRKVRHLAVKESLGKSIPSNMAFGGCGDTLAAIRTTNKLLFDVIDCPDYVREFDLYLMKQWIEIYENSYNITKEAAEGSTCWFSLWSPGKFYASHCDFAYMISPKMFIDIFLPVIEMQTNYLDNTVHHLDGIGNFVHIDALLELPKLQAIQVAPGAGKPSPLYYMDILKKVQPKRKNLHITIKPEEVEYALSELSARGLFISTNCDTEEEAKYLLKMVEKWSKDRR